LGKVFFEIFRIYTLMWHSGMCYYVTGLQKTPGF